MTVKLAPSSVTFLPMTSPSPPKRRVQRPWLSTATPGAPARPSSGSKNRPSAGPPASMVRKPGLTRLAVTRTGPVSPERLKLDPALL